MDEKYNLLRKDQIGVQRQCSAIDATMALTHEIEQAKHAKEITTALFMDVSGAFDNVSKDCLLHTLRQLGYPIPIQHWVDHFLLKRTTALAFDGRKEDLSPVLTGIPQGSPASPILFLLYL